MLLQSASEFKISLLSNYPNASAKDLGAGRITVDAREKEVT
jgi:hypothetical protein